MYLRVDVLLLADTFEKFVSTCVTRYKLDPTWYYTTPGYGWDCSFFITKQNLELLSDTDMIEFFLHDAIRGAFNM